MKNNLNIRIGHRVKFSGGNSQLVPNGCDYSLEGKVTGFHESGRAFVITDAGNEWFVHINRLTKI